MYVKRCDVGSVRQLTVGAVVALWLIKVDTRTIELIIYITDFIAVTSFETRQQAIMLHCLPKRVNNLLASIG
jgi:hypothetical protein